MAVEPNEEEIAVLQHLDAAAQQILDWGLKGNAAELFHGLHTLQSFVTAHMLQRLGGPWGQWYETRNNDMNSAADMQSVADSTKT